MKLTRCVVQTEHNSPGWLIQFPYDRYFLTEFKECIDRGYREWHEASKSWWVDEFAGEWLPQLFENWDIPLQPKRPVQSKKCPLGKCDGTGKIPFIKDGRAIPCTHIFCDCKEDNPERLSQDRARPSDFDFPMSDLFIGHAYEYCGKTYPSQTLVEPIPQTVEAKTSIEILEGGRNMGMTMFNQRFIGLQGAVRHAVNKLNEHVDASKKKRGLY